MTSGKTQSWPVGGAPPGGKGDWTSYVWGVLDLCQKRALETGPLDIVVHSTVPVGGGLSSSAALEVATATLVEAVTGQSLDPVEKALLCQQAEHEYAGVPCGIMDQFSSRDGSRQSADLARLSIRPGRTRPTRRRRCECPDHQHERQTCLDRW